MDVKIERKLRIKDLTNEKGVYALCDLDSIPLYVGQSMDGIRNRVSRHLTSARSDVIANRQLDIWEVYEVWAWPLPNSAKEDVSIVETHLIHLFNDQNPLVNGKLPERIEGVPVVPDKQTVQMISENERALRLTPSQRLPRQLEHLKNLFSHILEVKDNTEQRRMLKVHFDRSHSYYKRFMNEESPK